MGSTSPRASGRGGIEGGAGPKRGYAAAPAAFHPRPGGRPRLAYGLLPPPVPAVGTCRPVQARCEVRAHLARESDSAAATAQHSPAGGRAALSFPIHVAEGRWPLGAYGEVRAYIAPGKWEPQPQPHFISGPAGRPRPTFKVPRRRSTSPEAAGRFAHIVKCARVLRPLRSPPQPHLQGIRSMQ